MNVKQMPTAICSAFPCVVQSVVRHEGSSAFYGHYNADILGTVPRPGVPQDRTWRRHNDSVITPISTSDVLGSEAQAAAYMLFYVADF
jgi:hypothetical protein